MLRRVKRALLGLVDPKGGIMLSRPVAGGPAERRDAASARVLEISRFRSDLPLGEKDFRARLGSGDVAYGLEADGRLLAWGWVSGPDRTVRVLHRMHFTVPAASIYIWDCWTPPQERGRGHFQALLRGMMDNYSDMATSYVAVDSANKPSRRALAKTGFVPLFRYYGLQVLRRPVLAVAWDAWRIRGAQRAFDTLAGTPGTACDDPVTPDNTAGGR